MHIDNENKYILILGEGPTQRLYDNTLRAEANCASNFTEPKRQTLRHLGPEGAIASHLPPPPTFSPSNLFLHGILKGEK